MPYLYPRLDPAPTDAELRSLIRIHGSHCYSSHRPADIRSGVEVTFTFRDLVMQRRGPQAETPIIRVRIRRIGHTIVDGDTELHEVIFAAELIDANVRHFDLTDPNAPLQHGVCGFINPGRPAKLLPCPANHRVLLEPSRLRSRRDPSALALAG